MRTHQQLCLLNLCGAFCAVCSSLSCGFIWYYWRWALNTCDDMKACSCLLYGTWGFTEFSGGDSMNCSFVTFSPIPLLIWSMLMVMYHGLRHSTVKESQRILITNSPTIHREVMNPQRIPKLFAVCSSIIAISSAIVIFSSGIVLTDGYFKTCKEYKKNVVDQLDANGDLASLVTDRLSCGTVYDFLDYLQPDPEYIDYRHKRDGWLINTDLTFKFAIIMTWVTFALYTVLSILYIISSRKPKIPKTFMNTDL
ncbi:unnamed protein product [Nezara viridula]|uniref:Uncharacterized protein n=1 Tax=Nezara viridula TaxID=85310 RepID=A0A9P0HTG0_NEZVI|nr:unnamed protein product [Nezara viridula]